MNHNTEIIRDRNRAPRLHIKPWDETVCSVELLNPTRHMSIQPYRMPHDGFEYDVILSRKPESNVIVMHLDCSGLNFFYQPPLPKGSKAYRPPKVVGSYAVYHKSKAGDYTALGGKNYRAGKAFHLYRPQPIDAKGRKTWANLRVFPEANLLTVTIPWAFLETCTYPVRHAAGLEFGQTSIGGSTDYWNNVLMFKANGMPASDGTITGITARLSCRGGANNFNFDAALYADVSGGTNARLAYCAAGEGVSTPEGTLNWYTTTPPNGSLSITASTQYYFGIQCGAQTQTFYYDDPSAAEALGSADYNYPATFTQTATHNQRATIYATYSSAEIIPTLSIGGPVFVNPAA